MDIEFVSYDGKWPNLCRGVLVLKIDGKETSFGPMYEEGTNYDSFWTSGGRCGFTNNGESYIDHDEWIISKSELPEFLQPYTQKITNIFNENVPYGCCGGCL